MLFWYLWILRLDLSSHPVLRHPSVVIFRGKSFQLHCKGTHAFRVCVRSNFRYITTPCAWCFSEFDHNRSGICRLLNTGEENHTSTNVRISLQRAHCRAGNSFQMPRLRSLSLSFGWGVLYMDIHALVCTQPRWAYIWKSEVDIRCPVQWFSTFFETRSLTEPSSHRFG